MTILCGHERETLIWACRFVDSPEIGHCRKWAHGEYVACEAVQTPTKLAELIAAELRRRSIKLYGDVAEEEFSYPYIDVIAAQNGILVDYAASEASIKDEPCAIMAMPQARALLLRLWRLPEGAPTDDVLKAVAMP